MSQTKIKAGGFDVDVITGTTALTEAPASTDEFLISDGGVLKRLDASHVGGTNNNLFRVYRNGAQTLNHATSTKVQFNAETFDVNSKFDSSTNYRYTPASTGYYKLHAQVSFDANNSSGDYLRRAYLQIFKNGSSIARLNFRLLDSGSDIMDEVTFSVDAIDNSSDTDDYYEVFVEANNANGSNNCDVTGGAIYTYFTGYKLIT
jgi:hypothetical protein|tara:strand:- start:155 stop:766 length:612 start_codon:yes stop_codon:yes gene_type:complete